MKLEIWGVRGSSATPDADKVRYGGNTLSVVVTVPSMPRHFFVLDAGTGLARFGSDLLDITKEYKAHVLLSNLHLYHIIGLQFTPLAFSPLCQTVVIGPNTRNIALETVFDHIMSPSYSPVYGLAHLRADAQFEEVKAGAFTVQDMQVTPYPFGLRTDGETWGYRLSDGNATVAYVTDAQMRHANGDFVPEALALARDVQLLVVGAFDPSHEREKYMTYQDGLDLARQAGVKQLCFTHHHPKATDDELDAVQQDLYENVKDIEVIVATEGTVFEI